MRKKIRISLFVFQNNKMRLFYSILFMVGLSVIYFTLGQYPIEKKEFFIDWIGGTGNQVYSVSKLMIKLSYISLIFFYVGKMIENIKSSFSGYLAVRYGSREKLITEFTDLIILYGVLLVLIFQFIFAGVGVIYFKEWDWLINNFKGYCYFVFIECISIAGVILLYIILDIFFHVEYSILYIMSLYIVHTIVPYDFPFAITLCKMGEIYINGEMILFLGENLLTTVLAFILFRYLMRTRKY